MSGEGQAVKDVQVIRDEGCKMSGYGGGCTAGGGQGGALTTPHPCTPPHPLPLHPRSDHKDKIDESVWEAEAGVIAALVGHGWCC